jgi:hypothetical protein
MRLKMDVRQSRRFQTARVNSYSHPMLRQHRFQAGFSSSPCTNARRLKDLYHERGA